MKCDEHDVAHIAGVKRSKLVSPKPLNKRDYILPLIILFIVLLIWTIFFIEVGVFLVLQCIFMFMFFIIEPEKCGYCKVNWMRHSVHPNMQVCPNCKRIQITDSSSD
jgi:hypothetical protein